MLGIFSFPKFHPANALHVQTISPLLLFYLSIYEFHLILISFMARRGGRPRQAQVLKSRGWLGC